MGLFFLLTIQAASAKDTLVDDCSHLKDAKEADFILFNKKEFIELGECLAIDTLKKQSVNNLPRICKEVTENEATPLGIMSLTKLEAIYIGQCIGAINYIYQRYNNERLAQGYRGPSEYSCVKGMKAVKLIINQGQNDMTRRDIRDILCTAK